MSNCESNMQKLMMRKRLHKDHAAELEMAGEVLGSKEAA